MARWLSDWKLEGRVWNVTPEEPLGTLDPAQRMAALAVMGFSQLSADSLLNRNFQGEIVSIVQNAIVKIDSSFGKGGKQEREKSTRTLLEVALNFLGFERKRAGFTEDDSSDVIDLVISTLRKWEALDRGESVRGATDGLLKEMRMVLSGKGMVAKMAEEIGSSLSATDVGASFIEASRKAIQGNVYYRIVDGGLSKFGNDSATGLRWARHLGAVQVSSNPVIAARAYEEIPDLWTKFEAVTETRPEWHSDPDSFADQIALCGTVVSLLPNILDFRPLALLSNFKDGMVSIQLNPRKATDVEASVKDALTFYSILNGILQEYDKYLVPEPNSTNSRPNIVFKVSTIGPEAVQLTEALDSRGIGTNNTVTFTVSQEIRAMLAAMKGLVSAVKNGLPITTIYITNMEGRLEDHLRETKAASILLESLVGVDDQQGKLANIAQKLGLQNDTSYVGESVRQRVDFLCGKKFLKSLEDEWFVEAVGRDKAAMLKQSESDIRMSGIYVTRKVYQLMFRPDFRTSLVDHIEQENDMIRSDAVKVVEAVDLLPASKRRAEDTYLVLGDRLLTNLTNTEFPDHQLKVLQKSRESGFDLYEFEDSIDEEPDAEILERLLQMPDFRSAYELTSDLVRELQKSGVEVRSESAGIEPADWRNYGPARKTMDEFNSAYVAFRDKLVASIKIRNSAQPEKIAHPM